MDSKVEWVCVPSGDQLIICAIDGITIGASAINANVWKLLAPKGRELAFRAAVADAEQNLRSKQ